MADFIYIGETLSVGQTKSMRALSDTSGQTPKTEPNGVEYNVTLDANGNILINNSNTSQLVWSLNPFLSLPLCPTNSSYKATFGSESNGCYSSLSITINDSSGRQYFSTSDPASDFQGDQDGGGSFFFIDSNNNYELMLIINPVLSTGESSGIITQWYPISKVAPPPPQTITSWAMAVDSVRLLSGFSPLGTGLLCPANIYNTISNAMQAFNKSQSSSFSPTQTQAMNFFLNQVQYQWSHIVPGNPMTIEAFSGMVQQANFQMQTAIPNSRAA